MFFFFIYIPAFWRRKRNEEEDLHTATTVVGGRYHREKEERRDLREKDRFRMIWEKKGGRGGGEGKASVGRNINANCIHPEKIHTRS